VGEGLAPFAVAVSVRLETENPGRMSGRLPDGVFFRFGLYGGGVLAVEATATWSLRNIGGVTIRHVPDTGGRLATVSERLCGQADGL